MNAGGVEADGTAEDVNRPRFLVSRVRIPGRDFLSVSEGESEPWVDPLGTAEGLVDTSGVVFQAAFVGQ